MLDGVQEELNLSLYGAHDWWSDFIERTDVEYEYLYTSTTGMLALSLVGVTTRQFNLIKSNESFKEKSVVIVSLCWSPWIASH
jgi:hypothetical protein